MNKSTQIALGVTLLATAAALYIRWRNRQDDTDAPSLLDPNVNQNLYFMEYDFLGREDLSRGYRNNNPVNIRIGSSKWAGKIYPSADKEFEQFRDLVHGYRAALVLLRGSGYINKGINTIRQIITKFAPKNENNTAGYIQRVSSLTGIDPDTVISRNDRDSLCKIVYAMSIVENDSNKYKEANHAAGLPSMDIINKAWEIM